MLAQLQAGTDAADQLGERSLADLDRLAPQIAAIELQEVERIEKHRGLIYAVA
jgi:hypothetical protein